MFEKEIARYEELRQRYEEKIAGRMNPHDWQEYNEILFSAHSCAIEGTGRTGRLLSNFILMRAGHPLLVIDVNDRAAYISALRQIRTEGTDEHLIAFFFQTAIKRMEGELEQKQQNTKPLF